MEDGKITGRIENAETGEISYSPHCLFCQEFELKALVKIVNIESRTHTETDMQIFVDCLGLDGLCFVFELRLEFVLCTVNEMNRIIEDLKVNDIFIVSGIYYVAYETLITIFNPEYAPARLHLSEEEIEVFTEAFRIYSKNLEDI